MTKKNQVIKHVPMRTCVVTHEKKTKKELIRIVFDKEHDRLVVDIKGKLKGRGANILPDLKIFDLAIKRKSFERALKLSKHLTKEEIEVLRKEFEEKIEEKAFRPNNKPVRIKMKLEAGSLKLKARKLVTRNS
jgi:uncharacterized protein